jgi:hypothetical protein
MVKNVFLGVNTLDLIFLVTLWLLESELQMMRRLQKKYKK